LIIDFLQNSNPMNLSGISTRSTVAAKSFSQVIEAEFCTCDCPYSELAFHSTSTDEWKNDKASFLVRRGAATEAWVFQLYKAGLLVATITSSTYGEYYDFGSLAYADLKGMVIYWKQVYDAFGNGDYTVRIEKTFGGVSVATESHTFMVRPYSFEQASGTVKLETYQNGTFVATGYTLRGVNWYQSMRMQGIFWNKQPKVETNEYFNSDRLRTQIWDKIVNTYSLELRMLPSFISNAVIYDQLLANTIYLTDYNINNEVYRKVPVRLDGIAEAEYYQRNTAGNFEFTFNDLSEGTIKGY
jgi:hypothetical protein